MEGKAVKAFEIEYDFEGMKTELGENLPIYVPSLIIDGECDEDTFVIDSVKYSYKDEIIWIYKDGSYIERAIWEALYDRSDEIHEMVWMK